ncbi:5-methyltetrahydropteroyltriglutamate--homocysteine methyltransferase [Lecanosticta acicola]|uniref:5-methyltetrahydropteroyltriglutamate--homocysteine methyltransferase n=1 Tax=Lecanosticta acicola TaxID=111012 RepID=A0AAI8Z954_9PEZI|nr:5-methyltetrahydropteroyltriglutamate--homocysteine methyltransferase [Lecanosticta acicola]
MAPRRTSSDRSSDDVSTLDLVFACAVCQRTVSEAYATDAHEHGLHSGDGEEEGAVTKMWIADCSHVFCGKHLEGGGIPFHPAGIEHAEVVCPVCVKVKNIRTKRRVFWIRGLSRGQYQDIVPPKWFICPPEKLNSRDDLDDAIRFQYFNLDLYAKGATQKWRSAERKRHSLEKHHHQERKQWQKREAELKARITELEKKEVKLEKWEQRRKVINSALASFHAMEEDIESMRTQLVNLGFKVPRRSYSFALSKPAEASWPHRGDHSKNLTDGATAQSPATLSGCAVERYSS